MSRRKTAEQAKAEDIAKMGEDLGEVFHALWQEVAWLHEKWGEYVIMFGTKPSRIELMNKAAPKFFRIVKDSLWEDVILHIARLTERSKSFQKGNLTIRKLLDLLQEPELKSKISLLVDKSIETSKFCKDWRNRRIAHRDFRLALEKGVKPLKSASRKLIKDALKSLVDVLNAVSMHYQDSETDFDLHLGLGGGESLLYVIDDGLKAAEERKERIRKGEYSEEDYRQRDI